LLKIKIYDYVGGAIVYCEQKCMVYIYIYERTPNVHVKDDLDA